MYKPVYSPDGEFFEVPQHKFEELVLDKGWTQTKPQSAPAEEAKEKPAPRRAASKPVKVEEEDVPVAEEKADEKKSAK